MDRKGVNVLQVEVCVGIHEDCGGEIFFILDNPFGTYYCKKCKESVTGQNINNLKIVKKKGGE